MWNGIKINLLKFEGFNDLRESALRIQHAPKYRNGTSPYIMSWNKDLIVNWIYRKYFEEWVMDYRKEKYWRKKFKEKSLKKQILKNECRGWELNLHPCTQLMHHSVLDSWSIQAS